MAKYSCICLVAALFHILGCSSIPHNPPEQKLHPNIPIQNPFFFLAEKGDQSWWMLGTQHEISATELPKFIHDEFEKTPVVIVEVTDAGASVSTPLYRRKRTDKRPSVDAARMLLRRGIRQEVIATWSLPGLCRLYCHATNRAQGMDSYFEERAVNKKKILIGLDKPRTVTKTAKDQLSDCDLEVVTKLPPEEMDNIGRQALDRYRTGDFAILNAEIDLNQDALKERNLLWMKRLRKFHHPRAFLLVGASHLDGPSGILNLLASEGFSVTRLTAPEVTK